MGKRFNMITIQNLVVLPEKWFVDIGEKKCHDDNVADVSKPVGRNGLPSLILERMGKMLDY